ncbi:hypothetical protein Kpol_354p9 [Vanderwaltozyma polyspora DSM 70294]|uniref:ATPase expression protein 3 n=1 Tax=Vanderwaltozyma polyspora (strain ATCC 22028 / DSM 70294 / BCRC 21397 / CBS 2163 / NBRC 10782 / NRRL Y-8283 / UCD 57-17) TaxID=436907 RepID=A7TSK3_VANPO|nr:uncharacterized protein Kpol_354p9 [Vanderwaltozyma polyspora DSM 70294]EDO14761.1 hypothetical protein Kpol_354p9 [Vanderwaltozyma polyspora DSM 70294]
MNVLNRVGNALAKNTLKSDVLKKELVLPEYFTNTNSIKDHSIREVKSCITRDCSKNEYVRKNINLVGHNSNFQKKMIQEYLSPLSALPLKRHDINNDYNVSQIQSLKTYLNAMKQKEDPSATVFKISKRFVSDMIASLIKCTPKSMAIVEDHHTKFAYKPFTFDEVPRIPDFEVYPQQFAPYIGLLTHTKFLYRNSSKTNGIIPKILRNLMHPGNVKTLHLRSANTFNDLIYFFGGKSDFATCRELFVQMKSEGISPNTRTYNLMLRIALKYSSIQNGNIPSSSVLFYLKNMKQNNVDADHVTWATCYNFLQDDISRDIFIEQMKARNIPIHTNFLYSVLRSGNYSCAESLNFLTKNSIPINYKILDLCVNKLIQEDKVGIAWELLNFTMCRKPNVKINASVINRFIRLFASKGRIDLALMTYNKYMKQSGILPDTNTFEMLFKSLVNNGYTKHFMYTLQYLKDLKEVNGLGKYKTYWVVKSNSIAEFNCKVEIVDSKMAGIKTRLDNLSWPKTGYTDNVWFISDADTRKSLRLLGCIPGSFKKKQSKVTETSNSTSEVSIKKQQYRDRIKKIALQNSFINRIDYAKGWYESLRNELTKRKII